ncbi:MAG: M6 family metalloprotease domain-containing protein [Saprospiraceae bacterium]|nr:M6 family metalloprotease domain-containing protein [Saprospiraceae bacterium]
MPEHFTFTDFFHFWASSRRSEPMHGLDDGHLEHSTETELARIVRPGKKLRGVIKTMVLLVDFPDRSHNPVYTQEYFRRLLFGEPGTFPTGSMRDYYRLISRFDPMDDTGIDVQGEVFGWLTLPQTSDYYTDDNSGLGSFPRNIQTMAKDAVTAAKNAGLNFTGFDVFDEGQLTALFIIHAGRGAEETGRRSDIWSAKWAIPGQGVQVAPNVFAKTFLTVPEDCKVGVCAHEWGHLAARWADYYDTGEETNYVSNGLGDYCLMASGSWGNQGLTPVYPNGMLRMFHGWTDVLVINAPQKNIKIKAVSEGGSVVVIRNAAKMTSKQYILVEYRRKKDQDAFLPDEGMAVYVIDETINDVNDESRLAIELMQADGKRDLAGVFNSGNRGDSKDLYPHGQKRTLSKSSKPALKFPGGQASGVKLVAKGKPGADDQLTLDVFFY